MTDKLVNKHYVDSNFYTRLKHRETMATMIFDKGIAIPHDVNYNNHKVIFALGVFPDELKVNKNTSVQLIFLLGIPDEVGIYEKLIVRIYNEIIHIAKDKNKVKEAGLTPITTPSGSKAFSEAWMIIECRKMVSQTINIDGISDPELRKQWAGKAMHKMFIGEILNVWVK